MHKHLVTTAVLVVIAGIIFAVTSEPVVPPELVVEEDVAAEPALQQFANVGLGIAFAYPGGSDGYTLIEPETTPAESNLLKTIMLVHADDMPMIENPPVGGEGPPVLTMTIFSNEKELSVARWAEANQNYSNFELSVTEPTQISVAGAEALRYRVDGLYLSQVVVIAHAGFIYVLNGGYRDETAPMFRDFEIILNSITFPTTS